MDPALCSGDEQADAAAPQDERHLLPARRDVRESRDRMEVFVPRGRLSRADHRVYAFSDSNRVNIHPEKERKGMGRLSKAGSRVLRFLLVEAGIKAAREAAEMKKLYYRVMQRREQARAKVAVTRHLLIRTFIMLRDESDYAEFKLRGTEMRSHARTIHRPTMPDQLIERPASA